MKKRNYLSLVYQYRMILILLAMLIFFGIANPNFVSLFNLRNIVNQTAYAMVCGVGITFIMLAGGMDLSAGYMVGLIGVCVGMLLELGTIPVPVVILIGLALGFFLGLINGVLTVKLKVFPLIITLATSYAFQGIGSILSDAKTISITNESFKVLGQGYVGPIPLGIIIAVVIVVIASFILQKTYFGRYIYGIGGNEEAMQLAGLKTGRMKILLYGICGFFIAIGTILLVSKTGSVKIGSGVGVEFTCLTAGILGGISFRGGEGKAWGMVVGLLILQVLGNGMQLMGLGTYPQYIAKCIVLVVAVGLDGNNILARPKRAKTLPTEPKK